MEQATKWWNRHQVALYLAAILIGAFIGLSAPQAAPTLEHTIEPVLMLLLFATFLAVPLTEIGQAFRDIRFLGTILVTNFIVVPAIAWGLSRLVADNQGLLLGVLFVLLAPCIDYVIVFTGIAGGARAKLLAATPLLMLLQIVFLPLYLYFFVGTEVLSVIEIGPFVRAFILLIIIPLAAAALVQAVARRHRVGTFIQNLMDGAMVPLMMITLIVVIGSQIAAVGSQITTLIRVIPIYIAFVIIAVSVGKFAGKITHLDPPSTRAVIFSTTTRNSLVVLPMTLALPSQLGIASLAVVTQTLVELVAMVILVRGVPLIVREAGGSVVST